MDETDVALCRLLVYNGRLPYSALAKEVGISVQSAHRRVQELMAAGVIESFNVAFTTRGYRSIWVIVHGESSASNVDEVLVALKDEPYMDMAFLTGEKYLFLQGNVVDPAKLNRFVSRVSKIAQLVKPQIDMVHLPMVMDMEGEPPIYPLDIRLVELLKNDARRPVTELAKELGMSPRTINRHIDRLVRERLVHFSFVWRPDRSGDIFALLRLTIKKEADREQVALSVVRKLASREILSYSFSNRPDVFTAMVWSSSIKDLLDLYFDLEKEGVFQEVMTYVVLDVRYYAGSAKEIPAVSTGAPSGQ
jgi:Lrp/AsnC family transcriptional regulator, regulator for asnA, asnC and gidA